MTNKEILEKAIHKAIDGGWPTILAASMVEWSVYDDPINGRPGVSHKLANRLVGVWSFPEVIYDPQFAKALWGEELHHETFTVPKELNKRFAGTRNLDIKPIWQYHLREMVIADDPIKYLGENI